MGDPEDDDEEEEEEKKKGEEDEEEEENDGEEDEVPWQVTVPDSRGMRATMRCSAPYFPLPPTLCAADSSRITPESKGDSKGIAMRTCWRMTAILGLLLAADAVHAQQNYPARPVRLIVPFPPGGAVDVIGRIVAPRLSERLGQQVVVDNRGGANAIIGTEITARAAPDGYTILIVPAGHAITPSVARKLPYDSIKDFASIGLIGNGAYVLVVNPALPAKTVSEFVALAKTRPGQLNYASTGHGNATHLAAELFKVLAGIDMVGVNYKGGGPALTDLIGGQISAFFSGVASGSAQIKAGKVRALGVTTARRTTALPDVPTIAEAGVPGYEFDGWYGLLAPAATPPDVIARLNRDLAALVSSAEMKERLLAAGVDARASSPAEFHDRIARDITRWSEVVKKARIAVE
jgi:tripartite-type tricarboxylate transporter receptor subunit TctC